VLVNVYINIRPSQLFYARVSVLNIIVIFININQNISTGLEVLIPVGMKITIFWDITSCSRYLLSRRYLARLIRP
jgi:hypothetical protein